SDSQSTRVAASRSIGRSSIRSWRGFRHELFLPGSSCRQHGSWRENSRPIGTRLLAPTPNLEAAGFVCGSVGRGTFVESTPQSSSPPPPSAVRGTPAPAMPWTSLVARTAQPEILGRAERYARGVEGRDVVNLARMQPSLDLL